MFFLQGQTATMNAKSTRNTEVLKLAARSLSVTSKCLLSDIRCDTVCVHLSGYFLSPELTIDIYKTGVQLLHSSFNVDDNTCKAESAPHPRRFISIPIMF